MRFKATRFTSHVDKKQVIICQVEIYLKIENALNDKVK